MTEAIKGYSLREMGKVLEAQGFELKNEFYAWERISTVYYYKKNSHTELLSVTFEGDVILHGDRAPTFVNEDVTMECSIAEVGFSAYHIYSWRIRGAEKIIASLPKLEENLRKAWNAAASVMALPEGS